jgi:thioredoxin-dependent peroxiredoxin
MKTFLTTLLCITGLGTNFTVAQAEESDGKLKLGDPIPEVASVDQNGKTINLTEFARNEYTLVYFYPKAMTPGCTAQACSLRDAYTQLQAKGVKVVGVSLDSVENQKEFAEKEHLPFELLSDANKQVTTAFGVPLIKDAYAARQAYLFKDGRLVWLDTRASTDKQAEDVLAVLADR